jgi:hypothetical protein
LSKDDAKEIIRYHKSWGNSVKEDKGKNCIHVTIKAKEQPVPLRVKIGIGRPRWAARAIAGATASTTAGYLASSDGDSGGGDGGGGDGGGGDGGGGDGGTF